jgi:hypothetical protein
MIFQNTKLRLPLIKERVLLVRLLVVALICLILGASSHAQVCPFLSAGTSLARDGVVLTRYARGIRDAALVSNTGYHMSQAGPLAEKIGCASCGYNITGNIDGFGMAVVTPSDAIIASRAMAGLTGIALTRGISLGSGSRKTTQAVSDFIAAGCGQPRYAIVDVVPRGGKVRPDAELRFVFSVPVPAALFQASLTVSPAIPCTWRWNNSATIATCAPSQPLAAGVTYQVAVAAPFVNASAYPHAVGLNHEFSTTSAATLRSEGITSSGSAFFDGEGTFRIQCFPTHMAHDDSIVYPDQPGRAHLHTFFGNLNANAYSTINSVETSGLTTCHGGVLNRSAYWIPTVLDKEGMPIWPELSSFYYKSTVLKHVRSTIKPFPEGLKMIAGNMHATPSQPQRTGALSMSCDTRPTGGMIDPDEAREPNVSFPDCAQGNEIIVQINFPSCWDGVNLDSANHRDHVAYPVFNPQAGLHQCPITHPTALPTVIQKVFYKVTDLSGTQGWHLSSDMYDVARNRGGFSLHADWKNGWDQPVLKTWVTNCINAGMHCANGALGDGTRLVRERDIGSREIR